MKGLVCLQVVKTFKPGDQPPQGYLDWHEWARVQYAAGLRQARCSGRESVRLDECAAAVAKKEGGIVDVAFRTSWVPVDFGPAVEFLAKGARL